MSNNYPELERAQSLIKETLKTEEEKFLVLLDRGIKILNEELEKVEIPWVQIETFESRANPTEVLTVKCSTIRGKPEYLFVLLEHVYNKVGGNTGNNPKVVTLHIEHWGETLKCISELDANALYHLTRRNSHIHADVRENYRETGAVLLTRDDCMDFAKYRGYDGVDMFQLNVAVTSLIYAPLDEAGSSGMDVDDLDIKMNVLFFYMPSAFHNMSED